MKALIIGGGVIGLCSAYYLHQAGWEVSVLDKSPMQDGCSYGNAGMVVPSHIVPLAAPGMISQGIRWMFSAESPFYIKPRLNWDLLKWGWYFYRSATAQHVQQSVPVLRDISLLSKELYLELATHPSFQFAFEQKGLMMLYKTSSAEEEETHVAKMANGAGVEARILSATEVQELEPEIRLNVRGGVYYPGDAHLDPALFVRGLQNYLRDRGVRLFPNTEVLRLNQSGHSISLIETNQGTYQADQYILASGSWSGLLAHDLGLSLPLQAGKGYSFNLEEPTKSLRIPSILTEAKVAVTPMPGKIRFAGTMEIGGINKAINLQRVAGIVKSIPRYLPDYQLPMPKTEHIWYGLRPCSPDGLPYIGRSRKISNLIIAAGHAMMGLSLAPATGKLVSEITSGEATTISAAALDPERFG